MGVLRLAAALAVSVGVLADASAGTYGNPLTVLLANGEPAQNCADPAVLRDPRADKPTWYMY